MSERESEWLLGYMLSYSKNFIFIRSTYVCMSLVQSVSQSVIQCTLTSHYATEFTVNAYNLVGVTFVELVHNLCVPNVPHNDWRRKNKKNKNNNNIHIIEWIKEAFSLSHVCGDNSLVITFSPPTIFTKLIWLWVLALWFHFD